MNDFPDKEGTAERGGKLNIGYAQQAKPNGVGDYDRGPDIPPMGEVSEGRSVGEDVLLADSEHLIFGVFDGASIAGYESREIALIAAKTIKQFLVASSAMEGTSSIDIMSMAFDAAIEKISITGSRCKTTATVPWIRRLEDKNYEITGAQAGDSVMAIIDPETDGFEMLTDEQHIVYFGSPARLTNWLGAKAYARGTSEESQFFTRVVKPGTRLIVCSDGVIKALKDPEVRKTLVGLTAQEAADALVAASTADDDKTALVVDLS